MQLNGKERKQKNVKRKDDSVDLNTNSFSVINGGLIHYLLLRVCAQMWEGVVWKPDGGLLIIIKDSLNRMLVYRDK